MDLFHQNNINECTKTDFLDTNIYKSNDHSKEKKMLHKLARSRLKQQLIKVLGNWGLFIMPIGRL